MLIGWNSVWLQASSLFPMYRARSQNCISAHMEQTAWGPWRTICSIWQNVSWIRTADCTLNQQWMFESVCAVNPQTNSTSIRRSYTLSQPFSSLCLHLHLADFFVQSDIQGRRLCLSNVMFLFVLLMTGLSLLLLPLLFVKQGYTKDRSKPIIKHRL